MHGERTEVEIAWAAGLFEGEGCWSVYRRKSGKMQIQARLAMTDADVVDRFAAIVGCGHLRSHHSAVHRSRGDKPMREWYVYEAEKVRELIALFLPYMGQRRRAKALEVLDRGSGVQSHNLKKTHCPRGHELSGDNLELERLRRPSLQNPDREYFARRCRTCRQEQARERARKRLGITPDRYRI